MSALETQYELFGSNAFGDSTDMAKGVSTATREADPLPQTPPRSQAQVHTYGSLSAMEAACRQCRGCGLAANRNHVVISRGNPRARLMLVGEGPGQHEDESGLPFVGRAGQLLDRILASVGIDRDHGLYVCNVVKCRPPNNRKPTTEEMASCRPWLQEQIRLVDPAIVLLAGASAVEGLLGIKGGITRLRGRWIERDGKAYMPVFHPSYLLRNASREKGKPKWLTWEDFKAVRARLDSLDDDAVAGGRTNEIRCEP